MYRRTRVCQAEARVVALAEGALPQQDIPAFRIKAAASPPPAINSTSERGSRRREFLLGREFLRRTAGERAFLRHQSRTVGFKMRSTAARP